MDRLELTALPQTETPVFSQATGIIQLDGAINEVVAFQIGLRAMEGASTVTAITATDLRQGEATIGGERVRFYRQEHIVVEDYPAWYHRLTGQGQARRAFADPLIPFSAPSGALPIQLQPGRCEAVWAEVRIPFGAEPGLYRGTVQVVSGSHVVHELELVLTVWPFAIPQTRHLAVLAGLDLATLIRHHLEVEGQPYAPTRLQSDDPQYERAVAIFDATLRLVHDHRCNPLVTDIQPVRRVGPGGRLELAWSDYDRLIAAVVDGAAFTDRAAATAWPMPISTKHPPPVRYGGWGSASYHDFLRSYLGQCVTHFDERGWMDRSFVWLPPPGRTRGMRFAQFEELGPVLRSASDRLPILSRLTPQSMEPYGWTGDPYRELSPWVDIWCPPAEMADAEALAQQRAAGKRTWLAPGDPPFTGSLSVIAPPEHPRSLPWQAYRLEHEAVLLPETNAWPDNLVEPRAAGSDQALLWPGSRYGLGGPVPTIRLKRLLRGLQDYEYFWLLERNGREGIARLIAADLFRYAGTDCYGEHFLDGRGPGWVTDPSAWSLARRLMARELVAALEDVGATTGDEGRPEHAERFEQQIEWARLARAVRHVRVQVEGSRVSFDVTDTLRPVIIEVTVSLFNATGRPFNGEMGLADMPEDWITGPAEPIELAPRKFTRRVIRARAKSIQATHEGIFPVRVKLKPGIIGMDPIVATGRIAALTSQRLKKTPVIDGKLDDWPLMIEVASDFSLVGRTASMQPDGSAAERPSQLTTVFVADDDAYLYIGFNCEDDALAERRIHRSNFVRYEDLWPAGEDLVEVVLDPSGRAIGPGDLLHVVVKANGAVVTERGVPCLDPVATHGAWSPGIDAAIDDTSQPGRWTVEMRIPLAVLGKRNEVWGINFARLDARRGEYASWSPAASYLYSPVTLGNMRLQPK